MLLPSDQAAPPTQVFKDRLPFTLPDFTRISWVSDDARQVWEPRIRRIVAAWQEIEWQAVSDGVRLCCVCMLGASELVTRSSRLARLGLTVLPLEVTGVAHQIYSSTTVPYDPTRPAAFRCVVGRTSDALAFLNAWEAADQDGIGHLLGYPDCCRTFFHRIWVNEGLVDTTWPMAAQTRGHSGDGQLLDVNGPWEANILWRWVGVRAVPHLPCRLDCTSTVSLARDLQGVARRHGYVEEMGWMQDMLRWPLEWSALHGIAEIKTPILKLAARTDSTATTYTVRYRGDGYPAEGARGLDFPYQQMTHRLITQSRGFQTGLAHALPMLDDNHAAGNGFRSLQAMEAAHRPIVDLARATLPPTGGAVIDLGCGNGALLKKIVEAAPGAVPVGVERDEQRAVQARLVLPRLAENLTVGDVCEPVGAWRERRYVLALLMPGRLLEASPAQASNLRTWLRRHCDHIIVYAYGDWLDRFGDLDRLARAAGLRITRPQSTATAALAVVGDDGEGS